MAPTGVGPRILVESVEQKIGRQLRRLAGVSTVTVGVLFPNPASDASDTPLAIVCEFGHGVSDVVFRELHRLTWNFSKAPLLITVEPTLLRVWSCYKRPSHDPIEWRNAEIENLQLRIDTPDLELAILRSLHWTSLLSGYLFRQYSSQFQESHRADQTLLENLKYVRKELRKQGLSLDIVHDLLARIIFIQFLFHRQDISGEPALNGDLLERLFQESVLSNKYSSLEGILWNYKDAYRFFRWLNEKFNGDLFPGKGASSEEREAEWQKELHDVEPKHLNLLAQFVSGSLQMQTGQYSLWPLYQFDAIPLEFISSIYEEFVKGGDDSTGTHYTPSHLVDFVLDGVLPWNETSWDVKILDPACGSGIFLVKAFQRLIYRWRLANSNDPPPSVLSSLLTNNLFGVDLNPEAVRVASFSLYLAMCDAIDPRRYWQDVRFPRLRENYLIPADFFSESVKGVSSIQDREKYDLVVGNAPWGKSTGVSNEVGLWARKHKWLVVNKDIGTVFLAKAAILASRNGRVAMLQSANSLLFNQSPTAVAFRKKFFSSYKVEEVVNFSALRFGLFANSVSPTVCVTFRPVSPDGEPISYVCLKPVDTSEDSFRVVIEPHDISEVFPEEAVNEDTVWTVKMWGGSRDLELVRRLRQKKNLRDLEKSGAVKVRKGVVWGDKSQKVNLPNGRWRLFDQREFPNDCWLELPIETLPELSEEILIDEADSPDLTPFLSPQLIIKKGWKVAAGRFQAVSSSDLSVICNQSYVSVHFTHKHEEWLNSALSSLNSQVAAYYLMMTSGRFASYRPEPLLNDFKLIPLPEPSSLPTEPVSSDVDINDRVNRALSLSEVDKILIADLFEYILPDFRSRNTSPARQPAYKFNPDRPTQTSEALESYCDTFIKVLQAGFGADKTICATIYQTNVTFLPAQLVALHLDWSRDERILQHRITETELLTQLSDIYSRILRPETGFSSGVVYHRVLRWYDVPFIDGRRVPTIFLIKPNEIRYWLQSVALQDADKVAADLVSWSLSYEAS